MNNIYTNLSEVYEMMYQTFINYDEEFEYYSSKLHKNTALSIIELGCGTGNLAKRFIANGYNYTGLDLNTEMLSIAAKKNPLSSFVEADMRNFQLTAKKDACIIAGRTISHLITNADLLETFEAINKNLKRGGLVCFDCIDAHKFNAHFNNKNKMIHHAEFEERKFHRESYWSVNESESWTYNWHSVYFETGEDGMSQKIGEDDLTIRTFTREDICVLLELCNFIVKETEDRPSYAFDTFVIVAQKIK